MKKLSFYYLAFFACFFVVFTAAAQSVTRNVSGYTGVECNGPFNVQIKIDGTESLKLDVDADILKDIKTEIDGGILKINLKNNWRGRRNIKRANIYITAKQLSYLGNGGSGSVVLDGAITGNSAKLAVSGSGDLKAVVRCQSLELNISGSGSLNTNGSAKNTAANISGSGSANADQLTTQTLNARISGSGGVSIKANQSVSASISGSGGVDYSGNAKIADTRYSGSGRVNKVD